VLRPRHRRRSAEQQASDPSQISATGASQIEHYPQDRADAPYAVYLSPDDRYLAVCGQENLLSVYYLNGHQLGDKIAERQIDVSTQVAWSPNSDLLAFVNARGLGVVLALPSGQSYFPLGLSDAIAFYPDGAQLAVLSGQRLNLYPVDSAPVATRTIDVPTRRIEWPYKASDQGATIPGNLLAISPDARWLACNIGFSTIQIVDAVRLTPVRELTGHSHFITSLEWLGTDILASSSVDGTIRIWQADTGGELRLLEPGGPVLGFAHAPVRGELESWTSDTHHVWSVASGQILLQEPVVMSTRWKYPKLRYVAASQSGPFIVKLGGRPQPI
jgi:WD40 repeat protein